MKLSIEEFISRSKKIHNNKYDYSLVKYKNTYTKVIIICPNHGQFEQRPDNHLRGRECYNCKGKKITTKNFIDESNKVHNNFYDYSLVKYISGKHKVKIICPKHGTFLQRAKCHKEGSGCSKCSNNFSSKEPFSNKAKKVHGEYYDYSLVEYVNNHTKVKIICPKHGEFKQSPNRHLSGCGCPLCRESKGERKIRVFLINNNIDYISQKRFKGCKDKYPLRFDFYIPKLNLCIEYDGQQHFKSVDIFGGDIEFDNRIRRDKLKSRYCIENNIQLLRIKYNENINEKLQDIMKEL
jgi:very-short-patch-repair endonuclease